MNSVIRSIVFVLFCFFFKAAVVKAETDSLKWVEDSFGDFADGELDAAGQNIYISRDGKIRTIHRFDLNDDGYIDLIFNSASDENENVRATLASITTDRQAHTSELAVEGSLQAEVADLNNDGWLDVVFRPNFISQFLTLIWGGPDGWPAHRSNGFLPVNSPQAITTADLNNDAWKDIVTLNSPAWLSGQPRGRIVRLFWGGERGFALSRYQDIGIKHAIALTAADFDSDGSDDIAILKSNATIEILWGKKTDQTSLDFESSTLSLPKGNVTCIIAADCNHDNELDLVIGSDQDRLYIVLGRPGRSWDGPLKIMGFGATHLTVDDIDGDSYADIVTTLYQVKFIDDNLMVDADTDAESGFSILWGGPEGFTASRSTTIPANQLTATAVGDFDGDGKKDVAAAIRYEKNTFATNSHIYFGIGNRRFEKAKQGIPTFDAFHVTTIPASRGKRPYLVFSNNQKGNVPRDVQLKLYLGGPGGFSTDRLINIPFRTGDESTTADFNADGFLDHMAMYTMHGRLSQEDPYAGANIFWGGPEGIDFLAKLGNKRTVLPEIRVTTSNTADLNRDGYLDIVLSKEAKETVIYYGALDGYNSSRRIALPLPAVAQGSVIADFDKDDWLDIALCCGKGGWRIYSGSFDGFDQNRYSAIDVHAFHSLETADLNNDGWLDVITCLDTVAKARPNDCGAYIYWGGPSGFKAWNAQKLPGYYVLAPVVADFDGDGFLDVFNPHYLGVGTREFFPSYIYWGGAQGFDTTRRTALTNNSAIDGLAADFNRDGLLDLAVPNHRTDGNHYTFSKVFYNDGNRFLNPRIERLPTQGPHYMWDEDMGHIYDRTYRQHYRSSLFSWNQPAQTGRLTHQADIPEGTHLAFSIRAAARKDTVYKQTWRPVASDTFSLEPDDRYLQYQAIFTSDNGDRYPLLDRVSIVLTAGP